MSNSDQFKLSRAEPRPGTRSCLKCARDFESEDVTKIRVCRKCKSGGTWRGSSASDAALPPGGKIRAMKDVSGLTEATPRKGKRKSESRVPGEIKTRKPHGPQPHMRASMARKARLASEAKIAAEKEDQ
jgi:hypothetical protein